jgi:hypothetical protein
MALHGGHYELQKIPKQELRLSYFSFFSFGVLHLMLPEAPQPYVLLYYPRIGRSNFPHQFRAAAPHKQRKLQL